MTEVAGYDEFEFDLPEALLRKLIQALDAVEPAALSAEALSRLPEVQGVYQLFLRKDDTLDRVYIGKTDSEAGLKRRLLKHARKVKGRVGLSPGDVFFKALRVFVFTAVDLETQLIKHYGGVSAVPWNGSGFGANDPGRERDTTKYKADHFDTRYPIDIDGSLDCELPETASAAEMLKRLKQNLPYLIRFQGAAPKARTPHPELAATTVTLTAADRVSPATVLSAVVRQLPAGWHATMLPSHVIVYRDDDRKFPSGRQLAQS